MSDHLKIRFAQLNDLVAIVEIFNQAVRARVNGSLKELNVDEQSKWFDNFHPDTYPIYVAQINEKVVGYCYLAPYRPGRQAMASVAEISYYIDYDHHQQGAASALIQHTINDCERLGKKSLLAVLLDINLPSISILEKFDFEQWGHYPGIIDLDGRACGQLIYGLKL